MNQDLQRMDAGAVEAVTKPVTPTEIMLNAFARAVQTGTDPSVMKEQMAMLEKLLNDQRKERHQKALSLVKKDMGPVLKTKRVDNLYSYCPLDAVVLQVREVLEKHGFTWTFDQDPAPAGSVTGVCIVSHSGHSERRAVTLPISTGNRASNPTKDAAGALSFAQRRAFQNAFGIVVQGEETDAHIKALPKGPSSKRGDDGKPIDPQREAMKRLWTLLEPVRGQEKPVSWRIAEAWLDKNKIIERNQEVSKLTNDEIEVVIEKSDLTLNPPK